MMDTEERWRRIMDGNKLMSLDGRKPATKPYTAIQKLEKSEIRLSINESRLDNGCVEICPMPKAC